ncbi:hypothetical protein BH09BAC1_BH09BAC1_04360 [soil metagenome]
MIAKLTDEPKNRLWIIAIICGFFAFALYANTIPNGYALDDELVTINHPLTSQGIGAIPTIFTSYYYNNNVGNYYEYRPMVLASYAIEHTLFGDSPHVSHTINALLYALSCFLLFFIIRSFNTSWSWLLPALATLMFAAHPLHTEVVASIKNRDEILSFIFGILALYTALKFSRHGKWQQWLLFVLLLILAVTSKRTALSYAVIIPLACVWLSSTNYLRMLAIGLPLSLIFLFFSPNRQADFVSAIPFVVFLFPLACLSVQKLLLEGKGSWKKMFGSNKLEPTTKPGIRSKFESINGLKFLVFPLLFVLAPALPYLFLYYNLPVLFYITLVIGLIALLYAHGENKIMVAQALFLAIAIVPYYFPLDSTILRPYLSLAFLLLLLPSLWMGTWQNKALASLPAIIQAGLSFYFIDEPINSLVAYVVITVVVFGLYFLKSNKKVIYGIFAVIASGVSIFLSNPSIGILPKLAIILLFGLLAVPFLQQRKWAIWGVICFSGLCLSYFTLSHYPNVVYEQNLGAYYKAQPDPYGDGVQNPLSVVPNAGRFVDPVENPLVDVTDLKVKLATSIKVMGYYTYLMVAPVNLSFYYGYNQITLGSFKQLYVLLSMLALLVLFIAALLTYKQHRVLSFSLLFLLLGLLFISNFGVLLTGIVGERLAYSATLGYCLALAYGLMWLFKIPFDKHQQWKQTNKKFLVVVVLLLGTYSVRTVVRNMDWKDKFTLYKHDIKHLKQSAKAHQLLGYEYIQLAASNPQQAKTYYTLAEQYLKQAIAIAPKFHTALYNLAYLYTVQQNCKAALTYFEKFMVVTTPPPDARFHYATCLDLTGRMQEAISQYQLVITMEPYFLPAYTNLSYIYFRSGNYDKAIEYNKKAIDIMPNEPDPIINMGKVYLQLNQPEQALQYFEKALVLAPNDMNLILTLVDMHSQIGDKNRAQALYNKALQLGYKPQ